MTKLEKLPCLVLQYEWKLAKFCKDKVFLSRKMKYQGDNFFQTALKWLSSPTSSLPQLAFTAINLNKLGLKTYSVSFSMDVELGGASEPGPPRIGRKWYRALKTSVDLSPRGEKEIYGSYSTHLWWRRSRQK